MEGLGFALRGQAILLVLTEDVLKTSEIEGQQLNPDTVRPSQLPAPKSGKPAESPPVFKTLPDGRVVQLPQDSDVEFLLVPNAQSPASKPEKAK